MSQAKEKIFKSKVRVQGGLLSSYVFENEDAANAWLAKDFVDLQAKYGPLSAALSSLPGLKIGDACRVIGDGEEEYVIEGLVAYNANRFGFVLDSGFVEEVAKCYACPARER
jgi:hypothetical protein